MPLEDILARLDSDDPRARLRALQELRRAASA